MIMYAKHFWLLAILQIFAIVQSDELLGCGGFLKSHVQIDFSKVLIKLVTKQGVVKDQTNCAPKTGYYFIPLYDKGDYVLQLEPPPGWSFTPNKFEVSIDGKTDMCSQGKDINFVFKGFGIAGKVESYGSSNGAAGINVKLVSNEEVRETVTDNKGVFFFTPVYPGEYQVIASHKKWTFVKDKVSVTVKEGNTDLPSGSLILGGYDVKGFVKIEGAPVSGVKILLFAESAKTKVEQCNKSPLSSYKGSQPLCYVITDKEGSFVFPSVSTGKYKLVPYMEQHIHFAPSSSNFEIQFDSVKIEKPFEIIGVTAKGYVKSNDKPLANVAVTLDDNQHFVTKADGSFTLEKVKPGTHTLKADADEYNFPVVNFKLSPSSLTLPVINPKSFKVCGTVISDKMEGHIVSLTKMGSTTHLQAQSDANTGVFCEMLPGGKYQVQVNINDPAMQFFPVTQSIEVNAPLSNIVFSQLKVTVTGKVKCIKQEDCKRLKVIMRPIDKADEMIANVIDEKYTVSDIRPGEYRITLSSNRLCWETIEHLVQVSNATWAAPAFINTGYAVTFISSHDTSVIYAGKKIQVPKGTSEHCVPQPGTYKFKLDSCHKYETDVVDYSTSQELNEIVLSAMKHKVTVDIAAEENLGDLFIGVSVDMEKTIEGPLKYQNSKYTLTLFLAPNEKVILTPQSEIVFFNPPILSITGEEDCTDFGRKFVAKRGKVFRGKVIPPLEGVQINVKIIGSSDILTDETDSEGNYKFPPLDDSKTYEISAVKGSYVFVGPDAQGNFGASKLAEIVVDVIDKDTGVPLQGALLSLSGAESYRSNMQTDEHGTITFGSLSPSEYFLKPMMKEYHFEPASKVINVLNGASEKIVLRGKRIAHSAYGQVTSLSNSPEREMIVVASGINNCSDFAEEATTDLSGAFRIRGLIPHCSYKITVKASLQENDKIERVLPKDITVDSVTEDLTDLKLIVFRPSPNVDVYVKIYTSNPEHYRSLRLKITRESAPSGLVHNLKVDNYKVAPDNNVGILLSTPMLPLDSKMYSLQLESTNSAVQGKSNMKTITADSSYKFVELEFVAQSHVAEQQIKQVSVWKLLFIFGIMIAAYNIDKIMEYLTTHFNLQNSFTNLSKFKSNSQEYPILDNAEIDKIVKNINAPKVRTRRVQ